MPWCRDTARRTCTQSPDLLICVSDQVVKRAEMKHTKARLGLEPADDPNGLLGFNGAL